MTDYSKYAKNIFTQNGEDGIIEKLLEELNINNGVCVEFGAWDGVYLSNVYNLWRYKGYKAILIEDDQQKFLELKENTKNFKNTQAIKCHVVPDENDKNSLDNILERCELFCEKDYTLLSIDVDSCDYYIFKSIKKYFPKIIICETNTSFSPQQEYVSYNNGCSLLSLKKLAEEKNYKLIFHNGNAFFLRNDIFADLQKQEPELESIFSDTSKVNNFYQKINENGNIQEQPYYLSKKYKELIIREKQKL